MSEIQFIVDKLNEPPFLKDLRLVSLCVSSISFSVGWFCTEILTGLAFIQQKCILLCGFSLSSPLYLGRQRCDVTRVPLQHYPPAPQSIDWQYTTSCVFARRFLRCFGHQPSCTVRTRFDSIVASIRPRPGKVVAISSLFFTSHRSVTTAAALRARKMDLG